MRARHLAVFLCLIVGCAVGSYAQAPDCTGVPPVYNQDPDLDGELDTVLVASGFTLPLYVTQAPGETERLWVVEQQGLIRIIENGVVLPTPFLDIKTIVRAPGNNGGQNEQGLLGLAFHPDYETNGYFFVFHTNLSQTETLARYKVGANPLVADPSSREELITIPSFEWNHDGGMLAFSPVDGHLYVGTGDGGGACDFLGAGQDKNALNAKMLRLNVDSLPYTTTGNPFDGVTAGLDEIWAYGLRNPWRFSFDRVTGNLMIGDVGQNSREEINCQKANSSGGENYGWDYTEGNLCNTCGGAGSCTPPGYQAPVRFYATGGNCTVIGGYVYRGCAMPALAGHYFYADYCSGFIRSWRTDANCAVEPDINRNADLDPDGSGGVSITSITSFGEDNQGNLFIVDRGGEIFKIIPTLAIMEVSPAGAADALLLDDPGDYTWQDMNADTDRNDITQYRVYRSDTPNGIFNCVKRVGTTFWTGGDPDVPNEGEVFYYVVAARRGDGEETTGGAATDGTLRNVNTASVCGF